MPKVSGSKLADLTGFSWRTVKRRLTDAGVTAVGKHGNADLFDSRAALLALYEQPSDDPDFEDQRQRLAAAQAEKVEHENAVRRGDLVRRDDAVKFWTDCIASARARLLRLPSDCARDLPPEARGLVMATVQTGVHEALRALAEYEPDEA